MKKLLSILLLALLASCKNITVTDAERKAAGVVLKEYGGECNLSKGISRKGDENRSYITMNISGSKVLDDFENIAELTASNIAFIFYTYLGEEKKDLTHINVKMKFSDGKEAGYTFPLKEIEEADVFKSILISVTDKIKSKDYEGAYSLFDTADIADLTSLKLEKYCKHYDTSSGEIDATKFIGFSFFKNDQGNERVHLAGATIRTNGNVPISMVVDRANKKIMQFKFGF